MKKRREKRVMTNGEMIRNMTDEELAVTIMCPNETGHAEIECDHSDQCNCCECCLKWLKQEVEAWNKTERSAIDSRNLK